MLVLHRRKNESITIGDDVTVTVLEIRGDKVRLAIRCPSHISVHRQEVYEVVYRTDQPAAPPRSPEERAFLQGILEEPDDVDVRLIFADWLEDRGDPLGEFIHTQCRLATLPPGDEGRDGLEERERALWSEHADVWREHLPAILQDAPFERGFVEAVHLTTAEFLEHGEEIFAAAPVRRLRVRPGWDGGGGNPTEALSALPYLARLAGLDLRDLNLGDADAGLLAASGHASSLKSLVLRGNRIQDAGAGALAASAPLAGLVALDLAGNRIGEAGARALAASPHLTNLHRLDLAGNPLGKEGAQVLRARFDGRVQL